MASVSCLDDLHFTDVEWAWFWQQVPLSQFGCWEWPAIMRNDKGYGVFSLHGRTFNAYRVAYIFKHGKIPDKYHIDHLCANKPCIRPNHLDTC